MKKRTLLLIPSLCSACFILSQDCPAPVGGDFLHGNNVRAFINCGGNLFLEKGDPSFQIHGSEPAHSIYAQGLWLGAVGADGDLRVAAQAFGLLSGETDYYAGPLDETGTTNAENCRHWDRVWSVLRHQIEAHIRDFEDNGTVDAPIPEIMSWPGKGNPFFAEIHGFELPDTPQGLAPFFDRDGNGRYNPMAGDYPMVPRSEVIPEQIMWSVFNDAGGLHLESSGEPLQAEVQLTAWAFQCTDNLQLNNTVFTSYKVINRGEEALDSLHFGIWVDFDLGCQTDDGIGSIPNLNTAFVYNLDNEDDLACPRLAEGYGLNPPAQAVTVLNKGLSYITYHFNPSVGEPPPGITDPGSDLGYYRYLTGHSGDGIPFTFGGNGYDPSLANPVTRFVFPGDPNNPEEWSDLNDGIGTGDRRVVSGILLGTMFPGGTEEIDAAYSWFRAPGAGHLGNVSAMYDGIGNLQAWYDNRFEGYCLPKPPCPEDCIWAGDLNADGIANHYDLLALATGLNRQGPLRSGPYNWSPQSGDAWAAVQPNGTNAKHLDADGDGTAAPADLRFAIQHYNNTRPGYQPAAEYREGPELQLIADDPQFDFNNLSAGQGLASGFIQLTATVPELFGLAFTLEFDTAYFQTVQGVSYLNPSGRLLFEASPARALPGNSGHALADTAGTIGPGNFLRMWIKPRNVFSHPLSADTTLIRFKNIKAIRRDGAEIEIGGRTVVARFPGIAVTAKEAPENPDILLFPNPAGGRLEVRFPGRQAENITILDATGKPVWCRRGLFTDGASLDLGGLPGGVYFVRMQIGGAEVVRRVVLR